MSTKAFQKVKVGDRVRVTHAPTDYRFFNIGDQGVVLSSHGPEENWSVYVLFDDSPTVLKYASFPSNWHIQGRSDCPSEFACEFEIIEPQPSAGAG